MTVKELILALQEYPDDWRVATSGYEGGYADVVHVEGTELALDVNKSWYYGPHERAEDHPDRPKEPAVLVNPPC